MRTTLLAVLALVAAVAAPPATADPGHRYEGGCGVLAVYDPTAWYALGTPDAWHGLVYVHARPTDGGSPGVPTNDTVRARCDVYVNGALVVYDAVSSDGSFTAARLTYVARDVEIVALCEHVVVGSYPATYHCTDLGQTPVVPEPVADVVALLADEAGRLVRPADPTSCMPLAASAGRYGPVLVDDQGDVYVLGNSPEYRWYDCPPYDREPSEPVAQPTVASG